MNRLKNFIEIIMQLLASFFQYFQGKIKNLTSTQVNRIDSKFEKAKLPLRNRLIKLGCFTIAVSIMVLSALMLVKPGQEIVNPAAQNQWNRDFEAATKSFATTKYDDSLALTHQLLKNIGNNTTDLQDISARELLAKTYHVKGNFIKASEIYQSIFTIHADSLNERADIEKTSIAIKSLLGLGLVAQDLALYEYAKDTFLLAAKFSQIRLDENSPLKALSTSYIGNLHRIIGKLEAAQVAFENSNAYFQKNAKINVFENIIFNQLFANYYQDIGDYGKAEKLLTANSEVITKLSGKGNYLKTQNDLTLASVMIDKGQYKNAEEQLKLMRATSEQVFTEQYPESIKIQDYLAEVLRLRGGYAEAESMLLKNIALQEKVLPSNHPSIAQNINNLAVLYTSQGKFELAKPLFEKSRVMWELVLGAQHPSMGTSFNNLAGFYSAQGLYSEAQQNYNISKSILAKTYKADHPLMATHMNNVAELYRYQGMYAEAEPQHQKALEIREKIFGGDHPLVATSLNNLAELYSAQKRYAQARLLHDRALIVREKTLGATHPDVATSLNNLGLLEYFDGQYRQAETLHQRALTIHETTFGSNSSEVATDLNNLALTLAAQRQFDQAEHLLQRAIKIDEGILEGKHPNLATDLVNLGDLYRLKNLNEIAEKQYKRAILILENPAGVENYFLANALDKLAALYDATNRKGFAQISRLRAVQIRARVTSNSSEKAIRHL
jgi:Tfp pilus assembly protein PilF